jgi:alkanesulfonate monooxygenase SsuD/methylene tetrahydromethanopterin reductase-like flavin-dependent oxidoreductase (luciferase family)
MAATGPDAADRAARAAEQWGFSPDKETTIVGDATAVAAGVRRWADAGADVVVLQPTEDDPSPEEFVRFVGEEVAPLVR